MIKFYHCTWLRSRDWGSCCFENSLFTFFGAKITALLPMLNNQTPQTFWISSGGNVGWILYLNTWDHAKTQNISSANCGDISLGQFSICSGHIKLPAIIQLHCITVEKSNNQSYYAEEGFKWNDKIDLFFCKDKMLL